jgi:hypothetical protein
MGPPDTCRHGCGRHRRREGFFESVRSAKNLHRNLADESSEQPDFMHPGGLGRVQPAIFRNELTAKSVH